MLYSLFLNNRDETVYKWTHYFPIYERFFSPFVNKSVLMFEIGVFKGGSLKLWKKYLGPYALIVGIDINPDCTQYQERDCYVEIGDQSDVKFLSSLIKKYGRPDIVLDDGSHVMEDMNTTFQFLYPLLNNNGVYLVEDVHTCYWEEYNGGLKRENSFIEKAKDMIDYLNAYHVREKEMVNDFTNSTFSISFFDSIVAFEKRRHDAPHSMKTGRDVL